MSETREQYGSGKPKGLPVDYYQHLNDALGDLAAWSKEEGDELDYRDVLSVVIRLTGKHFPIKSIECENCNTPVNTNKRGPILCDSCTIALTKERSLCGCYSQMNDEGDVVCESCKWENA